MSQNSLHEIEKFFGCYLLCSTNPKYKGRTYIGFTVNPNRRIKQHNAGYDKGGAKRTSGKGPWDMVLIIHGFPNEISALRFEWAWQNPERSIRLKHLVPKTKSASFLFKFNVVCEMLRIGPWCRLPLTIRWLKQEYEQTFNLNKLPPPHMPIQYGPVTIVDINKNKCSKSSQQQTTKSKPLSKSNSLNLIMNTAYDSCYLCKLKFSQEDNINKTLKCIKCQQESHVLCLSKHFLKNDLENFLPIEGTCPKCNQLLLWGDLIRFKLGCYKDLDVSLEDIDNDAEIINSDSD